MTTGFSNRRSSPAVFVEDVLGTRRGDTNLDGNVDFADFLQLSANFGKLAASWSNGDFDGSGEVDFGDFLALSAELGFRSSL